MVTRAPAVFSNHASVIDVPLRGLLRCGCLVREAAEVQLVVGTADRASVAELDHVSALHQHRAVAEALDGAHVVGDEDDRAPFALEAEELLEALLLEGGVADGEHLVDQQDLRIDLDRDREREPHEHPGRVVLELQVQELLAVRRTRRSRRTVRGPRLRLSPSMIALMITLSRAVRSELNPTPSSMNGDSRPAIEIRPVSTP